MNLLLAGASSACEQQALNPRDAAPRRFCHASAAGFYSATSTQSQMVPARDDFRIQRFNFDFSQPMNLLRMACGAFLIPHVWGKFAGGAPAPGVVGLFTKAGLTPADFRVYVAAAAELAAGVALVLGVCTRWAALGAAALLMVAIYALQVVEGFGWAWNLGGFEYLVFWILCCLVVAMDSWRATRMR